MAQAYEINFDGLVGPTHHYAGLSLGNVASIHNAKTISNPKEAALQGLRKMKFLADLGIKQAVLPPHARPALDMLQKLGCKTVEDAPYSLLHACYSASAMWVANAATISPSADTHDGRLHITSANLASKFHRAMEVQTTTHILKRIFADDRYFVHHPALPCVDALGDEGAANHVRLAPSHGAVGVELFVFGKYGLDVSKACPQKFPARQSFEASSAIARLHGLSAEKTVFAQQHPAVVDAGVFHNDVISVGNGNTLLYHESAFLDTSAVLAELQHKYGDAPLHFLCVTEQEVTLEEAIHTYLFNSQLVTLQNGSMALIAPAECEENQAVKAKVAGWVDNPDNPLAAVHYLDVRESMRNGGGPACLRLRVVVDETELAAMHQEVLLTDALYEKLVTWVNIHYRDRLSIEDLRDPALAVESFSALDALTQILGLGSPYFFQKDCETA